MLVCEMMIIILVILTLSFLWLYHLFTKKSPVPHGLKEIPIERGLPIIGIIHKIEPHLVVYLKKLSEKHGSMFRINLGMRDVLILNDFDIMKKTLLDNGNNFSGRWTNQFFKEVAHDSGIIMKDGDVWSKQRSFVLKVLRDFGLGKSRSQEIVQNECGYLLEELEQLEGRTVDFSETIPIYTANIISKFIMNKRFVRDDPKINLIEKLVTETAKKRDLVSFVYLMFPGLENSRLFSKLVKIITKRDMEFFKAHNIFKDEIDEHLSRLDMNSEGEDLIDRFLIEQHQMKEKYGTVDTFTDWQLIRTSFELFIAGYETTSTTLGWSMMFMSRYPEIQNKVYNEIVDTIGKERMPTMNDKKSLNYTQAVMDEIFRLSTVAPLAVFHRTFNDSTVDGYFIPRDTMVFPNLLACHTDSKVWEKPLEFYPEHFLCKDDKGQIKYTPREELIPFGIGKRQCLGESLARMEFLIFYLSIIQRFEICFSEEISEKQYEEVLRGNEGFIRFSTIKDFRFKRRFYE